MKKAVFCFALLFAACKAETPAPPVPPAREPIAIEYVSAPELAVHKSPDDASPVVTKFLNGESVSVLSRKGEWVEVRTTDGSGWAKTAEIGGPATAAKEEENPTPRFRVAPSPVTQPGAHGTVYIEAEVNTEGEVISTKVVMNSTGSPALANQNAAAIAGAKFYPIVRKGKKVPFIYDYRVDY